MQILDFKSRVFLAPMAGITDLPMRRLVSSCGEGVMVSEMVAINALSRRNPKTYKIADVRNEPYPVVVQLVGSDPALFADAAKLVSELGAHSLDINMGCPVRKIVNNKSGSYLMQDMPLAAEIIKNVVKATPLKVSVKFRKGWDHNAVNAVDLPKCVKTAAPHTLRFTDVHARIFIPEPPTGISLPRLKMPSVFRLSATVTLHLRKKPRKCWIIPALTGL